jgi:spore germination protein KA
MESIPTGERTKTKVCVCYIRGLAEESLVEEVKRRVGEIKTDAILASSYIEQYIEDNPRSIFNTIAYTEKPEVVAANLLEGRVGLMIDGWPFVLTRPMLFIESFQTEDDYASRPVYASMIRIIRYIAYAISVLGPAIYVAVTTFHQELIPTPLLFTMIAAREGVPFPAAIEALIMMLTFEVLREAGVRLPRPIGQAISIVGALVMGDAAVSAGIVGTPMVIVVCDNGCVQLCGADAGGRRGIAALYVSGASKLHGRIWNRVRQFMDLGAFNFYPILWRSLPCAAGAASPRDMKDALIRAPFWKMRTRPEEMAVGDPVRQLP